MTGRASTLALIIAATMTGACRQNDAGETGQVSAADDGNAAAVPAPAADAPPTDNQGYEPTPIEGPQSVFTSLDVAKCKLIARNDEEAGYARHRCAGWQGYELELVESDLRQTLEVVRPDGKKNELNLSSLVAGGGFSSVGKTAEWRGSDSARPRTLTIRYGVNEDPDPKVAPRSYLVVVRLEAPACVVARVSPGPRQSEEAREMADATRLPACIGG